METTVVVFRKWKTNGDIIALFPELPADNEGYLCDSYEHVGQHGHPSAVAAAEVVERRLHPSPQVDRLVDERADEVLLKAIFITSSIVSAKDKWIPFSRCFGIPSRSFLFRFGKITVASLARLAARIFSFNPPIGRTRPRKVISPVMARSRLAGMPERAEAMAVAMVIPAEGPSLGIAPAGT